MIHKQKRGEHMNIITYMHNNHPIYISKNDLPCITNYYHNIVPTSKLLYRWYANNCLHRDNSLPSTIILIDFAYYYSKFGVQYRYIGYATIENTDVCEDMYTNKFINGVCPKLLSKQLNV